jgi:hypothetical protein
MIEVLRCGMSGASIPRPLSCELCVLTNQFLVDEFDVEPASAPWTVPEELDERSALST